jgi:hypothetical protein
MPSTRLADSRASETSQNAFRGTKKTKRKLSFDVAEGDSRATKMRKGAAELDGQDGKEKKKPRKRRRKRKIPVVSPSPERGQSQARDRAVSPARRRSTLGESESTLDDRDAGKLVTPSPRSTSSPAPLPNSPEAEIARLTQQLKDQTKVRSFLP